MAEVLFRLEGFEGPLELLLFLISKHKLNINDIQIAVLLEQYLEYIEKIDECDFEYAGEFLEMAARLILIKTLSLLPKHEEAAEMKKELEGRLIEYSLCRQAAARLSEDYIGDKVFVRMPTVPQAVKTYTSVHDPEVLLAAYAGLFDKRQRMKPVEASVFKPIVSHKIVSVSAGIVSVLRRLYKTGSCPVSEMFSGLQGKSEKIAAFLAVLELTKSGRIKINDDNTLITFEGRRIKRAT